jgi:hypothetical protein
MLPIYELKISENINDDSEVNFVALVDKPAIEKNFLAFQFVEPNNGERQIDFIPRCISYVINEGKSNEQAVAICNSMWEQHFASAKVSFDYDDTLSTTRGKELAKQCIDKGEDVYIISARDSKDGMLSVANELGIASSKVYATGSNKAKVEKIKELGISKHYDNNSDVVKELGSIGEKFMQQNFAISNEDKRIISGPLMIAEKPIYRNDDQGEYYIKFSAETIKQIAIKYAKKGFQNNVNLMHDSGSVVSGLTLFESFICDTKRGIMPMQGFEDLPNGSWFGSFYVENDAVWNDVKAGKFKGFSVEGLFKYKPTQTEMTAEMAADEILTLLNQTNEDFDSYIVE